MSFIALLPTSPFIFFMPLSSPWIIEGGEWESHDTKTLRNNNFIALDGYPMHFHQDDYHCSQWLTIIIINGCAQTHTKVEIKPFLHLKKTFSCAPTQQEMCPSFAYNTHHLVIGPNIVLCLVVSYEQRSKNLRAHLERTSYIGISHEYSISREIEGRNILSTKISTLS